MQDLEAPELARYAGGKNGAGVYQTIINCIPKHRVYVEAFAGSAAIYRRKMPAATSILVEKEPGQAAKLCGALSTTVIVGDGIRVMENYAQGVWAEGDLSDYFFYLDPPYLHSTRRDLSLYKCELTDAEHLHLVTSLLPRLSAAGARWALSGYRSAMYDEAAAASGWTRTDFQAMTRRGVATESLWTNYDPAAIRPAELTFYGGDFRERERLKRKAARWVSKLSGLPMLEQEFILERLASLGRFGDGIPSSPLVLPDRGDASLRASA